MFIYFLLLHSLMLWGKNCVLWGNTCVLIEYCEVKESVVLCIYFPFHLSFCREKSLWGHYVLYEVWHEVSGMYVLSSFHMLMSLRLWCYCNVFIVKCAVRLYCICLYLWGYEVTESIMLVGMKVMSVMLIWSFVIVFSFFKLSYF